MEPLYKMILSKKLQDDIAEDMGIDKPAEWLYNIS
jgi:hypothetical protein